MAGPVRIAILANGAQARREIASVSGSLSSLGRLAKGGLAAAGVYGLTQAVVGIGGAAVRAEAEFSTSMRLIGASTDATSTQMRQLNDLAIKLGQDTAFSASDAAGAMVELAKAGLDAKTIYGGGVAGTLQLAAAGGTELGTAATIAANAMNAFKLEGKDMASIAAALAGGANASTASVESLGQGLSQVGAGATNAGLSLQETVAALAAFDSAGIKGSDAGTSLKTMLQRLVPQTEKANAAMERLGLDFVKGNGQFESLATIAQQLKERLGGLSDAQRTAALNTIFGSDASRAATVLMREGADGVRKYTKAANDQGAAQKLAKTRMDGTTGALERLNGVAETAKLRLGQELAPAVQSAADYLGDNLVPATDAVINGAKDLISAVKPAVSAIADLVPSADSAGSVFNDVLIPAISTLSDLVAGAVGFVDDLPGPLKEIGVEAGIAALVLPRLTASVTGASTAIGFNIARLKQLRAEMTYTETRAQTLSSMTSRLGGAARAAAGIGGLVALTEGAKESNDALSSLEITLGAAATGFSVGGPIGGGIGALGGIVYSLGTKFEGTRAKAIETYEQLSRTNPVEEARSSLEDLKSTLDQVTGAYTGATRAAVLKKLQDSDSIAVAAKYGISSRELVNATLGQRGALASLGPVVTDYQSKIEALTAKQDELRNAASSFEYVGVGDDLRSQMTTAAQESINKLEKEKKTAQEALAQLQQLPGALREQAAETRAAAAVTADYRGKLKGLPPEVKTVFRNDGVEAAVGDIARLARQYRLTPKQVKTVIEATRAEVTVQQVQRVIDRLKAAEKVKVKPDLAGPLQAAAAAAARVADNGGRNVVRQLERQLAKGKAQMPQLQPSLNTLLGGAAATGRSGAAGIGTAMKQGLPAGFAGADGLWSGQVRGAVAAAIAAGRAEARAKSPSRATADLGRDMGDGLVLGLQRKQKDAKDGGRSLAQAVLAGVVKGSGGVDNALERLEKLIRTKVTGKGDEKREKAILKAFRGQFNTLKESGRAQDKLNQKIEDARAALQAAQEQANAYSAGIQQAFVETGNLVNLGKNGAGKVTLPKLLSDLATKAKRAAEFTATLQDLAARGLSQTSLDQLAQAGPDAALETARAIASGGESAITQINAYASQIAAAGGQLGNSLAGQFYGAGVQAAQGLLQGLESEAAGLDRVARNLANSLVEQINRRLGIRSPSRVARGIGQNVVRGLGDGLAAHTYVHRQSARLGDAAIGGLGFESATAAYLSAPASVGPVEVVGRIVVDSNGVDAIMRGRQHVAEIQTYRSAGGRGSAKTAGER